MRNIRERAKAAKEDLSSMYSTTISIPNLFNHIDFEIRITRNKFESLCTELFGQIRSTIKQAKDKISDICSEIMEYEEHVERAEGDKVREIQQWIEEKNECIECDVFKGYHQDLTKILEDITHRMKNRENLANTDPDSCNEEDRDDVLLINNDTDLDDI